MMVLMDFLLAHPVLSAADAEAVLGSGTTVAYSAIERLEAAGILRPLTDRKRNRVWGASALLDELQTSTREFNGEPASHSQC